MSAKILVYAHWEQFSEPMLIGVLRADQVRGSESFRFAYDLAWLTSEYAQQIDSDLHLYQGEQFSQSDNNFRVFLDSCPDRWGRLLMQRREAVQARQEDRRPKRLFESDYLLGVHDMYRMGGIRFKTDPDGPFLDDNEQLAAPPLTSLGELEHAVSQVETSVDLDDPEYLRWLQMLISPGSSLGGARPKACVIDKNDDLWIAKFPSRYDDYDLAAWELVTYHLAIKAGVSMAPSRIERFNSPHHTFLTKRFDRDGAQRFHFSSAMMQLGYADGETGASYLELAHFLMERGSNTKQDLVQLWRRIVFSIAVSNCDDHLRNHGFIYSSKGWRLSPAYDINPEPNATGLHLNIDELDNRLDFNLAFEVIDYFQLSPTEANMIHKEVTEAVQQWRVVASALKIGRAEQQLMAPAFNC